jgi:hypothetical protein
VKILAMRAGREVYEGICEIVPETRSNADQVKKIICIAAELGVAPATPRPLRGGPKS